MIRYLLSGRQIPKTLFFTFLSLSFIVPILMTIVCNYFGMFGPGDLICWISKDFYWFRYSLYYAPLLVDNVVGLVFIILGLVKVCHFDKGKLRITHKKHIASAFKASLYGALFVVIILALTVNRTYEYIYGIEAIPFWMVLLKTSFAPAQGSLNAFCYFLFRTYDYNELLKRFVSNPHADRVKDKSAAAGKLFLRIDNLERVQSMALSSPSVSSSLSSSSPV